MSPSRRQIAPRLFSKERRLHNTHGLPPSIKYGLRAIAEREGQSVSWVLEQVIIEYFQLKRPRYIKREAECRARLSITLLPNVLR
jgi:hypothetical protein